MEVLFGIIGILLGGIWFYSAKNKKAILDTKLAQSKAKDQALKEQAEAVSAAIKILDAGIDKVKKQREDELKRRKEDSLTLKERADRIKKGLK